MPDTALGPRRPIPAERLAEALAPGLSREVAERLLASPRLGPRARAWALGGADAAVAALPAPDRGLARSGPDGLRRAASLAGAIWHAGRVRGLMLAPDLQPFLAAHGPAAREAALRHAALAPPAAPEPAGAALVDRVREDGLACVCAWIETLPAEAAKAVRLTLPADQERPPGDAHRAHGPAILRAVAAELGRGAGAAAP